MILNFSTKDGINTTLSLSKELLEIIDCLILIKGEAKVYSILKANGIRVKLPLIFIKVLHSRDQSNSNINSPSKLLFFFMNLSSKFYGKENLKLYLRSSKSKGLSKKYINELIKKNYFILTNNCKLREVLCISIVLAGYFQGNHVSY